MGVVEHLDKLATLYLHAGDSHRAHSFYRAARAIAAHPNENLERLRGVGQSTLAELTEYRKTGTSARLTGLLKAATPRALEAVENLNEVRTALATPDLPAEPVYPAVCPQTDSHVSILRETGAAFGFPKWIEETLDYANIRIVDHVVGYNLPALETLEVEAYIEKLTSLGYSAAVEIDVMIDGALAMQPTTPWIAALHAIPDRFTVERVLRALDDGPVSVSHLPRPMAGMHKIEEAMRARGVAVELVASAPPSHQLLDWLRSTGLRYYVGSGAATKKGALAYDADDGSFFGRIMAYLDPMLRLYR